ncbi:MAG: hypothetical protein E7264_00605 [Lachnospiraceae bacterium]|nr:hypothetical protein [Lachnospiraceae bacterium]
MKNIKQLLFTICLILVAAGSISINTYAAKEINTQVQSTNKIKLTWKKQKGVKGYKIYRFTCGNESTWKKELIASLDKNKTSFVDKKVKENQTYNYYICAYYYKNSKEKNKYSGWSDQVQTKLAKPRFDEHEDWHEGIYGLVKTSPNQIKIPIGPVSSVIGVDVLGTNSLKPDGIEVFKKVGKKYVSYKKIKIKSKKKKMYYFTDKNVKKGKTYKYKFRTYKKINGKTVYTKKTNAFAVCAMNNHTSVDVAVTKPFDTQEKTMEISITNQNDYGDFTNLDAIDYEFDNTIINYYLSFDIESYSTDQISWNTDVTTCKVEPGNTVYLRLKEIKSHSYESESDATSPTEEFSLCFKHKFYHYVLDYDVITNKKDVYHE